MDEKNTTRIDKWLWSVRIYKTRLLATKACSGGKVKINGLSVKASRKIQSGDQIQVRKGVVKHEYKILKIADKRMGAKMVSNYLNDITPEKELEKLKIAKIIPNQKREKGKGRPTKKERRSMENLRDKY